MRELRAALVAIVAVSLALGLAYPLAMTGVAELTGGAKARDALIGRDYSKDLSDFQSRPSATDYSADATFFNNQGPNQQELAVQLRKSLRAYMKRERLTDPSQVPSDAVTTSASGVDPDISVADARIQARRVARRRGLSRARVLALIGEHAGRPLLGLAGPGSVNVLELNRALDRETSR